MVALNDQSVGEANGKTPDRHWGYRGFSPQRSARWRIPAAGGFACLGTEGDL